MNLKSLPSILTNPINSEQARFIVDVTKLTYIEVGRNDEIGRTQSGAFQVFEYSSPVLTKLWSRIPGRVISNIPALLQVVRWEEANLHQDHKPAMRSREKEAAAAKDASDINHHILIVFGSAWPPASELKYVKHGLNCTHNTLAHLLEHTSPWQLAYVSGNFANLSPRQTSHIPCACALNNKLITHWFCSVQKNKHINTKFPKSSLHVLSKAKS